MAVPEELRFLRNTFAQVAYVVNDLDEAVANFEQKLGIGPFVVWENLCKNQQNKIYRGRPAEFEFSCGYGFSGDLQIELCLHVSGESVYKDWLDQRGPGLHHTGYWLRTDEAYDKAFKHFADNGFEVAQGGQYHEARWCYFDTVDLVGAYTEIYTMPAHVLPLMEQIKRGETVQFPE